MALTKQKKGEILKELEGLVQGAKSIVFVNFHRLTVADATVLRKNLREQGVGYKVAKKTLVIRALGSLKTAGELPPLDGEMAIAFGEDLIAPAREVYNFQKTHKESLKILGGVFESRYMNEAEMLSIATIPPLQTLRAMFVNLINSPIQRFVVALDQIAKSKA